jgi:hypothetical protein
LYSGEIAYVRRDTPAQAIFYMDGKAGPAGDVRWPAWSPDGSTVVHGRVTTAPRTTLRKIWSRSPKFELYSTGILSAYNHTGERFVATVTAANRQDSTLMLAEGEGAGSEIPCVLPDSAQVLYGAHPRRSCSFQLPATRLEGSPFCTIAAD